jgi:hypothetical protein
MCTRVSNDAPEKHGVEDAEDESMLGENAVRDFTAF